MKKKILLTIGLVMVLVLSLVGACAEPAEPAPTPMPEPEKPAPAPEEPAPAPEEPAPAPEEPAPAPGEPVYGGVLRILESAGPHTYLGLEPEKDFRAPLQVTPGLERLIRVDDHGEAKPWLATDWELAPDKRSCTITLRKGVKFHDGTEFNAEACVWNMERHKGTGTGQAADMWGTAEVIDDYTVLLKLNYWDNNFEGTLARCFQISPTLVKTKGEDYANWHPCGTGPFKFKEYSKDEYLKWERNDDYWQEGLPYLDGVEIIYIEDNMTRQAAFMAGEGDHIGHPLRSEIPKLLENEEIVPDYEPAYGCSPEVLEFDSKHGEFPFANEKVREAMWYAIDREALCAARGFGQWEPCEQWATPGAMAHIVELEGKRGYDPEKAKDLLEEAGYANGFKCELMPQAFLTDMDTLVAVQGMLKDVGIEAEVRPVSFGEYNEMRYQTGWQNTIAFNKFAVDANFATYMQTFCSEKGITGHMLYTSPEYNQAIEDAQSTEEMKPEAMEKVNRLAWEGAFQIPLYYEKWGGKRVSYAYVHDRGGNGQMSWQYWTPEKCWMSEH